MWDMLHFWAIAVADMDPVLPDLQIFLTETKILDFYRRLTSHQPMQNYF